MFIRNCHSDSETELESKDWQQWWVERWQQSVIVIEQVIKWQK